MTDREGVDVSEPTRTCSIEGCARLRHARGMCDMHYQRWRTKGDPGQAEPRILPRMPGSKCFVDGCEKPRAARGWCAMHYSRWLNDGDPGEAVSRHWVPPVERFWSKVDKHGPVATLRPDLGRCWVWTEGKVRGYGRFTIYHGDGVFQAFGAHRFAYEQVIGPIPEGLQLDHFACENPPCCNPAHLRPVTAWENVLRGRSRPAYNRAKTHCPQGHPYDDVNTYHTKAGTRMCRTCLRARDQASKAAARAARQAAAS